MPRGFFSDLKRRRVYRTAVIYAAAAWGLTEASTTIFEHLPVPEWASTLVVIAFLVGFPVAMYLAWVFDISPSGVRMTDPAQLSAGRRTSLSWIVDGVVGVIFLATLAMLVLEGADI